MEQLLRIAEFILKSFLHIYPYLIITIPLAVVINISGASKYITYAFGKNPILSVLFATIVGAFSPFCSCGVIPVISSLLIGGVPLAPVMSFWIASPSMDPEIFFLSSSVLGWKLAVWRLLSTFIISLLAGYITHFASVKGYIGKNVLKIQSMTKNQIILKSPIKSLISIFTNKKIRISIIPANHLSVNQICCTVNVDTLHRETGSGAQTDPCGCNCNDLIEAGHQSPWMKLPKEIWKATLMVAKFMGLAFLITALIKFYLPNNFIDPIVTLGPFKQVIFAILIGIPMYTSNLTALPMIGGMIDHGLNQGAALSFLIAGTTTTLPAMVAVWGITKRRVFYLYLSFAIIGALLSGLCFNLFN